MASRKRPDERPFSEIAHPDTQLDSNNVFLERERVAWDGSDGYVMGSADGEYGHVSGFRGKITNTGHAHKKATGLGRLLRD